MPDGRRADGGAGVAAEDYRARKAAADADELRELRDRVDCRAVLERAGWALDAEGSTREYVRYRGGPARVLLVTHGGRGWFDPTDGTGLGRATRGDVVALAQYLWGGTLGHARRELRPLAGIAPRLEVPPALGGKDGEERPPFDAAAWDAAPRIRRGSQGWRYLERERGIPRATLARAVEGHDALREGVWGTVWAAHRDPAGGERGAALGWEMRGPKYKGFSSGGAKALFAAGATAPGSADRVAVCEGFVDALSLAALEGWRPGTLYVSTGGGWRDDAAWGLRARAAGEGAILVAATDDGGGGERLAGRIERIAGREGLAYERLRPTAGDWNDVLRGASPDGSGR